MKLCERAWLGDGRGGRGVAGFVLVVLATLLVVLSVEVVLQVRQYQRTGQGLIAVMNDTTRYRIDADTGLKLLNPRATRPAFRINSLGFRSNAVAPGPSGKVRIVVVGASTVMGELAATNESMFSARLERKLNEAAGGSRFEVVNAGIAGYRLDNQQTLIDRVIRPLAPDWIVVLPGFNDVSDFCTRARSDAPVPQRVPVFKMPDWWLSFNTVRRLTSFMRPPAPKSAAPVQGFDAAGYRQRMDSLLRVAMTAAPHVLVATNGRAFGAEQDATTQARLARSALSFANCLSPTGLIELYDSLNTVIEQSAKAAGVPLLDLARRVPRGEAFFGDATHFSPRGEELVSGLLFEALAQAGLKVERP